jgi:hypothetical protein
MVNSERHVAWFIKRIELLKVYDDIEGGGVYWRRLRGSSGMERE